MPNPEFLPEEGCREPDHETGYSRPGWYFWDETQAGCEGPFPTREIAEEKMNAYAKFIYEGTEY